MKYNFQSQHDDDGESLGESEFDAGSEERWHGIAVNELDLMDDLNQSSDDGTVVYIICSIHCTVLLLLLQRTVLYVLLVICSHNVRHFQYMKLKILTS